MEGITFAVCVCVCALERETERKREREEGGVSQCESLSMEMSSTCLPLM